MYDVASKPRSNWLSPRLAIPVLLGILFSCGDQAASSDGRLYESVPVLGAKAIFFTLLFTVAFIFGERLLRWFCVKNAERGDTLSCGDGTDGGPRTGHHHTRLIDYDRTSRNLLINGGIIALCWLPYIVCLYPGVYWSDTSKQLLMHYGVVALTDHHPFATTFLYGLMADIGKSLFGSAILGLYVIVLVQIVSAVLIFSYTTLYLRELGTPRVGCHIVLAFFALFPLFPVMFTSLVKDTLSVLFFIPFAMMYVRAFASEGRNLLQLRNAVLLFVLGLLACLTKKAMIYVIAPSMLFIAFAKMSGRAKASGVVVGMAIVLTMLAIVPHTVMPALHVAPGGVQESIPFAIQEVAHDVKYNGNELTTRDRETVSRFLQIEYSKIPGAYDWQIADPVKGTQLRNPAYLGDFLKLWAGQWIEHPLGHFESWVGLVEGWFSFVNKDGTPNYMVVCTESAWYYDPILSYVPDWPLKEAHSGAARALYDAEQGVPVVNFLFYRSIWASVLPCFILYLILGGKNVRHSFELFLSIMPMAMTFLYLMLVPVSGMGGEPTRYVFQLVCTLPIFFAHVFLRSGRDYSGCVITRI